LHIEDQAPAQWPTQYNTAGTTSHAVRPLMLAKPNFAGYKESAVFFSMSSKGSSNLRRSIGAILFVFLFSLPFHFHPVTESQQIAQECSCYCGGLSQLGSIPQPILADNPLPISTFLNFSDSVIISSDIVRTSSIRGPPVA
jgi:hypothetical protein